MPEERIYRVYRATSLAEVPSAIGKEEGCFLLFLAMNAQQLGDHEIRDVARELIKRGLAYVCVWGEDCSRVHDQFDLERDLNEPENLTVMTTWHEKETLEEALWYFKNVAFPDGGFLPTCKAWISVSVVNSDWDEVMQEELKKSA
jgi:hypothetical protein